MIFEWNLADRLSLGQTIVFAVQTIVLGVTFGAVKSRQKQRTAKRRRPKIRQA
jgi:hypothetical protein